MTEPPPSNIPELTVSELALSLKRTLEDTYARVRVRGELSKVKIHTSGHLYSDLKDAESVLNIICWRGTLSKLSIKPEEGLDVICTGRITSYPARSNYQMVVDNIELAGVGALLKQLEDRKKRLAAEGLFDENRKKPFPFIPRRIGVITSLTGAVIRDILHRLNDRFPLPVLLWGVKVQGDGAADEITKAIKGMNALPPSLRPDILIVARGGGSFEDLMPFNEENVVRATAESQIPIIAAVGHETDTTLIDYAADRRAPTPTAAAEFAVPERLALLSTVHNNETRLTETIRQKINTHHTIIHHIGARLKNPERLIENHIQRLDNADIKLKKAIQNGVQTLQNRLLRLAPRLIHPKDRLVQEAYKLRILGDRLTTLCRHHIDKQGHKVEQADKLLQALSFKSVLGRGFALLRDETGKPVSSLASLRQTEAFQVELNDGCVKARVEQ